MKARGFLSANNLIFVFASDGDWWAATGLWQSAAAVYVEVEKQQFHHGDEDAWSVAVKVAFKLWDFCSLR